MAHIGFDSLVLKLMHGKKHYSRATARKIAGRIGEDKYGREGMAKRSAAGRRRAARRRK